METIETTMTSNVAVPVGKIGDRSLEADLGEKNFMDEPQITKSEVSDDVKNVPETADWLLLSAKEEGLEETLSHLAEGDFDPGKEKDSVDLMLEEEPQIEEVNEVEEFERINKEAVVGRIRELEDQVVNLEEKNKELFEKVKQLETNKTLELQSLLEMAMIMHALLKEEDSEEKKLSMLEALVEVMSKLMMAMFVPEDEGAKGNIPEQSHERTNKKGKKRNLEEIVSALQEKGLLREQRPGQLNEHMEEVATQAA